MNLFISVIITIIIICLIGLVSKFARHKVIRENMSKADFSKEKNYYRDILKKYAPAELSFVDDFNVEFSREIVATILNLQIKRKIDIIDNKIIVLDENIEDLKKSEQFIMCGIKDGKFYYGKRQYIKEVAEYEAEKDGLVKLVDEETKKKRYLKTKIKLILVAVFVTVFMFFMLYMNIHLSSYDISKINQYVDTTILQIIVRSLLMMSILIFVIVMKVAIPVYDFSYRKSMAYLYCRTEKGEEINIKLEGLRKFLKDYTLMDTRERESILVWNEYLIYSLILGINKTDIVEDVMKVIEM